MQPLKLLQTLKSDMIEYISSKYPFFERGRDDLNKQLIDLMSKPGILFQDPVIQLVRKRKSVTFDPGLFSSSLHEKLPKNPYTHQVRAWKRLDERLPTVVATGTSSGKSECFMFPIADALTKAGFSKGNHRIGAICLYPMNALVEDQFFRFLKITEGTGLTVGIYNGTYKHLSAPIRKEILKKAKERNRYIDEASFFVDPEKPKTIPNILLTNYKMLEYMLLRTKDHRLFQDADLRFLVLDEAHNYTGTLGLEVACLLARLRVHLGKNADHFVPIATSATLLQPGKNEHEGTKSYQKAMREFFSQLFGKQFPDDSEWLIEDEFEGLPPFDISSLKPCLGARGRRI